MKKTIVVIPIGVAVIAVVAGIALNQQEIVPLPTPTSNQPSLQQTQENRCDPSYPDFCILPNTPDLDCGEIQYSNFKVLPPDPHGFDRDNDGIGCES